MTTCVYIYRFIFAYIYIWIDVGFSNVERFAVKSMHPRRTLWESMRVVKTACTLYRNASSMRKGSADRRSSFWSQERAQGDRQRQAAQAVLQLLTSVSHNPCAELSVSSNLPSSKSFWWTSFRWQFVRSMQLVGFAHMIWGILGKEIKDVGYGRCKINPGRKRSMIDEP